MNDRSEPSNEQADLKLLTHTGPWEVMSVEQGFLMTNIPCGFQRLVTQGNLMMGLVTLREGISKGVKVTSQEQCRAVQWPHCAYTQPSKKFQKMTQLEASR